METQHLGIRDQCEEGALYEREQSFGYQLARANRTLVNRINRAFVQAGHELTIEQWGLMKDISLNDGLPQAHLVDCACKDKTSVTRLLEGLERRDLVRRATDEHDRRQKKVFLTASGNALLDELFPIVKAAQVGVTSGISSDDLATVRKVLRQVYLNDKQDST